MSHVVAKQPNGLFALWSTVIDDFILVDVTRERIIAYEVEQEREGQEEKWSQWFKNIQKYKFMSFEEMVEYRKEVHEDDEDDE